MEKLIELLNEYENYLDTTNRDDIDVHFRHINWCDVKCFYNYSLIISKRYLFIKWLVDNDKIDRKKLEIRPFSDKLVYSDSDCTVYRSDTTYEMLLMLLAISDTPIDDLISYLK